MALVVVFRSVDRARRMLPLFSSRAAPASCNSLATNADLEICLSRTGRVCLFIAHVQRLQKLPICLAHGAERIFIDVSIPHGVGVYMFIAHARRL